VVMAWASFRVTGLLALAVSSACSCGLPYLVRCLTS
jgi:hypothetical protein